MRCRGITCLGNADKVFFLKRKLRQPQGNPVAGLHLLFFRYCTFPAVPRVGCLVAKITHTVSNSRDFSCFKCEQSFVCVSTEHKKRELNFQKHDIAFVNPFEYPDADILAGIGLADRHVFAFH